MDEEEGVEEKRRWGTGKGEEEGKWKREGEEDKVEEGEREHEGRRGRNDRTKETGGSHVLSMQ